MSTLERATARHAPLAIPRHRPFFGRDWRLGYALTLPVVLVIVGLIAYPLAYSVWLSLEDVKIGAPGTFIGLDNYSKILVDTNSRINAQFWNSARVTAIYTGGAMVGKFILGMTAALILNAQIKGRNLWRALLFLPWAIPAIVSAFSWKWIYNDVNGVINTFLLGIVAIDRPILFLAGLQAIPKETYEAAQIDGASTVQSFWHVTLPNLASVILVTVMLSAIWTTNSIQYVYILTNGGPGDATQTFPLLAVNQGLRAYDLGMAATIPLVFFPLFALMIYFLTRRMLRGEV